jgi:hypothetical protein
LDSFARRHGVNRETQERSSSLAGYGRRKLAGSERASHALIFIQILLGNIILRYLVRANLPLIGTPGMFHALH